MRVPLPLIGPSYSNRSLPLASQVSQNLYPEINPEARNIVSLHAFPGLKSFATLSGKGRGTHVMNDVQYVVYGNTLSSVDSAGASTSRGTIVGESIVDFADNGDQMVIVTGSTAYMYTASTTTLAEISDVDLVDPTTVTYINNQFVFDNNSETSERGEFVTTQLNKALTPANIVNPLDFAKADSHPDDILKVIIYNEMVMFFGSEGIDPWWNSGRGNPPFDKVQGASRPYGLASRTALDKTNEFIYFLDNERAPRRLFGLQVSNIGNPAIGDAWTGYTTVSDAVVYAFSLNQQNFAVFTFPTANKSWLYHEESNSWYELTFGTDGQRHRGISHSFVYGKNLIQDHSNGKLYELDLDTYTDNGEVIQRRRATATIHGGLYDMPGRELFYDRVEFVVQTGEGLATGQGSDPQLMIRRSDDGGRTWSAEEWHPLGAGGSYHIRVELQCQGSALQRIYELTYSEPTPFTLIEAYADISVGI